VKHIKTWPQSEIFHLTFSLATIINGHLQLGTEVLTRISKTCLQISYRYLSMSRAKLWRFSVPDAQMNVYSGYELTFKSVNCTMNCGYVKGQHSRLQFAQSRVIILSTIEHYYYFLLKIHYESFLPRHSQCFFKKKPVAVRSHKPTVNGYNNTTTYL
jgi:hypothetical protein